MRPLTLKPYKTLREGASWCLDIPAYLSETRNRQRKFYDTQKEAETAADIIKTRRSNFGDTLSLLSPARITEAAEAYKLLDSIQSDVSLLSVIQAHLRQEKLRRKSVTLKKLFELFIAHLREDEKSEGHLYKLEKTCERFPKLQSKLVADITAEDFEPVLHKLKASMRDAETRHLRAAFNFGKPKYLLVNPADELKLRGIKRRAVETIPVDVVERMLLHSLQIEIELLPFLTLGFFCAIRPNGELLKLEWRDIHLNDKNPEVVIRAEVNKTREARFIDLTENACAWLQAYLKTRRHPPAPSTRIVPFSFNILRKKREFIWNQAREENAKWVPTGMRHTFASCYYAKFESIDNLLKQLGHGSTDMLRKSYKRAVSREEAERFWSIMPPSSKGEKVIAFPAA
jgi:integrase